MHEAHVILHSLVKFSCAPTKTSFGCTMHFHATHNCDILLILFYIKFMLQTNTFQVVLAYNPTESYVIFIYADGGIKWSKGALAGINGGDGINSITLPGSQTTSILNVDQISNVENPGVWIFRVDRGMTFLKITVLYI